MLDIVIINYNTKELSARCIDSIVSTCHGITYQVHVVDNGSTDSSVEYLKRQFPECKIIALPENIGYGAACNKASELCVSEFILFSNSDIVFHEKCIERLLYSFHIKKNVGVVGAQQVYPNGTWQRSYGLFPGIMSSLCDVVGLTFFHRTFRSRFFTEKSPTTSIRSVSYVDGAIMCFKRSAFDLIHGFDESFFFFGEDVDACYSLRKKSYKVVVNPSAIATHIRGATRTWTKQADLHYLESNQRARYRFVRKVSTAFKVKLLAALDAGYYAELFVAHSLLAMLTSGNRSTKHHDKAEVCQHLVSVCVQEMESV